MKEIALLTTREVVKKVLIDRLYARDLDGTGRTLQDSTENNNERERAHLNLEVLEDWS